MTAALEPLPLWFIASALTILGAIWGSFASALCSRWPKGDSIISERSRCDHCGTTLSARELVPILSFLVQRGKCRACGAQITNDTLAIELACAAIGLGCAFLFPVVPAIGAAFFCWLLVPLIVLDWRHNWLPDGLLLWLGGIGLLFGWIMPTSPVMTDRIIGSAVGFAALESLRRGYAALRGIEAMGAGDPKMFGALGLWLGWQELPMLLLVASLIGLVDFARRYRRSRQADVKLPLGSYFGLAAIALLAANPV